MSLSDKVRNGLQFVTLAAVIATLAGCTVTPLYSAGSQGAPAKALASIEISDATDRVGQEVRNALIFAIAGGAGEPANPQYKLALNVSRQVSGVLYDKNNKDDTASAGRIVVKGDYNLTRADTGVTVKSGTRSSVALVDFSVQEFAKLRAIRDGENRAAKELAEIIRADLAGALAR